MIFLNEISVLLVTIVPLCSSYLSPYPHHSSRISHLLPSEILSPYLFSLSFCPSFINLPSEVHRGEFIPSDVSRSITFCLDQVIHPPSRSVIIVRLVKIYKSILVSPSSLTFSSPFLTSPLFPSHPSPILYSYSLSIHFQS